MIYLAGEPDDIWWNGEVKEIYLGADLVWKSGPDIYQVHQTDLVGRRTFHPLITITVPPGETWTVTIEGRFIATNRYPDTGTSRPSLAVGTSSSGLWDENALASHTDIVTATAPRIGIVTNSSRSPVDFTGTVTIDTR